MSYPSRAKVNSEIESLVREFTENKDKPGSFTAIDDLIRALQALSDTTIQTCMDTAYVDGYNKATKSMVQFVKTTFI